MRKSKPCSHAALPACRFAKRVARRGDRAPRLQSLKLTIAYDGTEYGGWQRQPNATSIQQLLEEALAKIAGTKVTLHGSGRTDAGVHARGQVASVTLNTPHSPQTLGRALNANLPEDIRVLRVQPAKPDFHARFSAQAKEYRYQIDAGPVADPFLRRYAWHHPRPLDIAAMRRAAKLIVGTQDFSALSANPMREIDTPVRTVTKLTVTLTGHLVVITARADGFLYKMVRSIVGALVKVGEGRMSVDELRAIIAGKKRTALVETAPAHGLFLEKVFY